MPVNSSSIFSRFPIHTRRRNICGGCTQRRSIMPRLSALPSARVRIDALKIHHLHIVRGTALAAEYTRQPFRVLEYEEYLDLLADFIERLDSRIVIERLFGEAPLGLLVAPNWGRSKNDLVRDIAKKFHDRDVHQGSRREPLPS